MMIFSNGFEMMREVALHSSFTKAAAALGVSGAAVSKQVKALEQRLGLVLFHRTTRTVSLTEAGKQLVDATNRSDEEISNLLEALSEGQNRPSGRLKINAPMAFGEKFLVGPIAEFALLYPDVVVDVEFDDKRVHLVEEGYDLIIRIGALEDSGLIAKRLCDFPLYICASPQFLKQHGLPTTPAELSKLPAVIYTNTANSPSFTYRTPGGADGSVTLSAAIYVNSIGMMLESTSRSVGFSLLPAFACQQQIDDGSLVRILADHTPTPHRSIYAIYPDRRFLPLKVRKFIDLLRDRLSDNIASN